MDNRNKHRYVATINAQQDDKINDVYCLYYDNLNFIKILMKNPCDGTRWRHIIPTNLSYNY